MNKYKIETNIEEFEMSLRDLKNTRIGKEPSESSDPLVILQKYNSLYNINVCILNDPEI
jgi:hypothetical protein